MLTQIKISYLFLKIYDPQIMSLLLSARLHDAIVRAGNQLFTRRALPFGGS
jgi:hypothetical protein